MSGSNDEIALYEDLREYDGEKEPKTQQEEYVIQESVSTLLNNDLECLKTVFSVKPPSQQSGCEEDSEVFENASKSHDDVLKILFSEVNEVKTEIRDIKESLASLRADRVQIAEILECVKSIKLLLKKKLEKKTTTCIVIGITTNIRINSTIGSTSSK